MPKRNPRSRLEPQPNAQGITRITVAGFKSISQEQSIEIRPLTILAGSNSSGKSSIMQPLLLLKQTLEAPNDPGALLLDGPNVKFTSVDELLPRMADGKPMKTFRVGIEIDAQETLTACYTQGKHEGFDVKQVIYNSEREKYRLYAGMSEGQLKRVLSNILKANLLAILMANPRLSISEMLSLVIGSDFNMVLTQNRCFFTLIIRPRGGPGLPWPLASDRIVENYILKLVHLPASRESLERNYPFTAVGPNFPGTFEYYVASVIEQWQAEGNDDKLEKVNRDLARLDLTRKVVAKRIDDTQIELLVNRHVHDEKDEDMVNIAGAGLGVLQVLPIIVALHAANQGQLLYIEQPENHLHPRAQSTMAEVLADAVMQGARLVVETHSDLLLLGIQTLVAEGKLPPEMVKLHWFTLQDDGTTLISSADLDKTGDTTAVL